MVRLSARRLALPPRPPLLDPSTSPRRTSTDPLPLRLLRRERPERDDKPSCSAPPAPHSVRPALHRRSRAHACSPEREARGWSKGRRASARRGGAGAGGWEAGEGGGWAAHGAECVEGGWDRVGEKGRGRDAQEREGGIESEREGGGGEGLSQRGREGRYRVREGEEEKEGSSRRGREGVDRVEEEGEGETEERLRERGVSEGGKEGMSRVGARHGCPA